MEEGLSKKLIPIGEAAKFLGVSIDTVRRWDERGILHPSRPNGKDRYFSLEELEKIKFSQPLPISEAAQRLGISESTLRRLEEQGMISPERNDQGERIYSHECLKKFLDSNYFLRQREIESKILEPQEDEETEEEKDKRLSTQRKIINAQLEEHNQKISRLITFRNIFYTTGLLLTTILVVSTLIIALLFLLFPKNTANWFGYRPSQIKIARTQGIVLGTEYDQTQGKVLGAEYDPDKITGPKNLLAKVFKPISQISLGVVKQINPETYYQIVPQTRIEDVNDILNINSNGEISTLYDLTFPDTSYLHIPDKNLIDNLNADYLRGKVPGQNPGDLAVLDAQNFIEGLKIDQSNISGQITNDIFGNAANVTGVVQVNHGGTGQTSFSNGQLLIGNAAGELSKSTLTAGTNIVITNGDGSVTIASTAQASTGANVGAAGVGVYRDNTGVVLNFKNINTGSNKLSVVDDVVNNEVDLDVIEANIIHNNLSGLTTGDPHIQYLFLNGRAGGQIVIGGTGAGENLTLQTTSNVVKGSYILSDLATGIVTSTAGTLSATATGDLTAGSNKIVIGGTGTGAVLGAGVSVDVDQTKLSLTVSQISDIATSYLKLDASNDPLTGDLSLGTNKLIFGTSGSEDTNLYRSTADTLKTDDAFASGVSINTPNIVTTSGSSLRILPGGATDVTKIGSGDPWAWAGWPTMQSDSNEDLWVNGIVGSRTALVTGYTGNAIGAIYVSGGTMYIARNATLYWATAGAGQTFLQDVIFRTNVQIGETDSISTPTLTIRAGRVTNDPYLLKTYSVTSATPASYQIDMFADNNLNAIRYLNLGTSTGTGGNAIAIGGAATDTIAFTGVLSIGGDANLYRSTADTLKTDDAFVSGVSVTTPLVTAGAGNNLTVKLGDAAGANKLSITDSANAERASIDSEGRLVLVNNNVGGPGYPLYFYKAMVDGNTIFDVYAYNNTTGVVESSAFNVYGGTAATGSFTAGDGGGFGYNSTNRLIPYQSAGDAATWLQAASAGRVWRLTSGTTDRLRIYSGAATNTYTTPIVFTPQINQSLAAGYTAFKLDVTQTAVGSGTKLLMDLQADTASKFKISNTGEGYFAGNVGIISTSPNFALDVSGGLRLEGSNRLYFGGTDAGDTLGNLYHDGTDFVFSDTIKPPGYKSSDGSAGLTSAVTVKGSDGINCTLTFKDGLLTASTCP